MPWQAGAKGVDAKRLCQLVMVAHRSADMAGALVHVLALAFKGAARPSNGRAFESDLNETAKHGRICADSYGAVSRPTTR